MTVQTAVLIETLVALGAAGPLGVVQHLLHAGPRRRGRSRSGPSALVEDPQGVPVYAWKGETLEEYWWCTEQVLRWPEPDGGPSVDSSMTVATPRLLVHKGAEYEKSRRRTLARDTADSARSLGSFWRCSNAPSPEDDKLWTGIAAVDPWCVGGDDHRCASASTR